MYLFKNWKDFLFGVLRSSHILKSAHFEGLFLGTDGQETGSLNSFLSVPEILGLNKVC